MQITCPECGCPYESYMTSCPECGCPTEYSNPTGTITITNCPNCGAPVGKNISCDYCGCAYPRIMQQAPQQVIINNNTQSNVDSDSVVLSSFLGGMVGGILSD